MDWMPRTEFEQAHVDRILEFQKQIPLDTPLNEASKLINAELARWQTKDGFWFAEENRPEPEAERNQQEGGFWKWMPLWFPAIALTASVIGFTRGFFDGVLAFFGTIFALVVIIVVVLVVEANSAKPKTPVGEQVLEARNRLGIRTDYTYRQKQDIELRAKWFLNYSAMHAFKWRLKEAGKAERDAKKALARKAGVFSTHHKPAKQPYGVSDEGAEALVAQWMIWLGVFDAQATKFVGDGGIDVESSVFIAQVKNFRGYVGVAPIRELKGVSAVDGRIPLFFTSGDYSKGADEWSEEAGVYLFQYDAKVGVLRPKNKLAEKAMVEGLAFVDLESK